jgi:hypothetical protein
VNTGDTFKIELPDTSHDSHLWILISDPIQSDECVIVNLTSWRADKDQSCVLEHEDHPYIVHRTCVNFIEAKRIKISAIQAGIQKGKVVPHAPASSAMLDRILEAIPNSRMPLGIAQFLADQGMIDL